MTAGSDILERAFSGPEWRTTADAFFQATQLTLFILDFEKHRAVFSSGRCGFCHLSLDAVTPGPGECYDALPRVGDAICQHTCRAGLTTISAPILADGRALAHVVLSGFVSSTRERRRLYEHLITRGAREEVARLAVRGMPVVTRRQIEAYAGLAASSAQAALAAAAVAQPAAPVASDETAPDVFLDTGTDVMAVLGDPVEMPRELLATALRLFAAEAGTIALARPGDYVEIVAASGEGVRPGGTRLRLEGGAAARALSSGRTVVVTGERSEIDARKCTVVAPLVRDGEPRGTIELRMAPGRIPLPEDVRRVERFAGFAALAIANAEGRAICERALVDFERLHELGLMLGNVTDAGQVSKVLVGALESSLDFDVAGIVLTSWGKDRAEVVVRADTNQSEVSMLIGEAAGRDLAREPIATVVPHERGGTIGEKGGVRENWAFISTPLASGDHVVGYLFCASASGVRYSAEDHRLIEGAAFHAAAAFERAALFSRIRDDFARTLAALASSLDAKVATSRGHSTRVMEYAMLVGEALDLPLEEIEQLRFAGLLHDIGGTGVTEEILLRPAQLSEEELVAARRRAELGATIVQQIEFLKGITPVILHHHERWDGAGYPMGLAGEDIPLAARILAVADAYDSMTSGGEHTPRLTHAAARRELEAAAGMQFDPTIVSVLLEALDRQALAGSTGLLAPQESKGRPELPA